MSLTYKDAGVDIDAGDALVERIKAIAGRASRPEVMGGIGGFAGLCRLPTGYREPLLVSGTDGVGTKLKTAFLLDTHDTVGIDLVAMCVNDVAVVGAEPLFFLDYFATGHLDARVGEAVVTGISSGCQQAGCALLGGETAELPGMYADGEYDLAGFCVGVVEKDDLRDGSTIAVGDAVIGMASNGLHSNGHSLARKAVLEVLGLSPGDTPEVLAGDAVGDVLLAPTRIYVAALRALGAAGITYKGAAHITGGGLVDNPPRMLRDEQLAFNFATDTWAVPPVFELIASAGVEADEMRRTFNMGIGMTVVVAADAAERAVEVLQSAGEKATVIGSIVPRDGGAAVRFDG